MRDPITIKLRMCPYDFVVRDNNGVEKIYQFQEQARHAILATGARILDTKWDWRPTAENPLGEMMSTVFTVGFPYEVKGAEFELMHRVDPFTKDVFVIVGLKLDFPT